MKTKVFFLTFIFAFPLFSYSETLDDETSKDKLYVMGCRNLTLDYPGGKGTWLPPEELVFTGDDIQSFNMTTREIIFNDFLFNDLEFINQILYHYIYNIYLNDKLLFENVLMSQGFGTLIVNDLVFCLESYPPLFLFLRDGFPEYSDDLYTTEELKERMQREQKENSEKRKEEWDIFIQYLSDAGKIAGNIDAIEPITPSELNDISIYPNPTTGELRMENGELTIKDVHIFDIFGRKIINYQLSIVNSMDISHLPAGIYFVRITTEKGVVTKKVVKK